MAKAKMTESGNVRVTMTPLQYEVITQILDFVRLGDMNAATTAISDFAIELEPFNAEFGFGIEENNVEVSFTRETKSGLTKQLDKVTIEVNMYDEDDEDDDEE